MQLSLCLEGYVRLKNSYIRNGMKNVKKKKSSKQSIHLKKFEKTLPTKHKQERKWSVKMIEVRNGQ